MSWTNPPPTVEQFRAQLLLCPTLVAAGLVEARYHYPAAIPSGDDADPMPLCVLADTNTKRVRYAEGTLPLIHGTLVATLFFDEATYATVGEVETIARQAMIELGSQQFGIAFKDMEVALASDLSPGQRAAGEDVAQARYRSIQIICNYGLSR